MHDIDWLRQRHDWPGLTALAMVESVREIAGKAERERRFYITKEAAKGLPPFLRTCAKGGW
jgi:hypothetical protein